MTGREYYRHINVCKKLTKEQLILRIEQLKEELDVLDEYKFNAIKNNDRNSLYDIMDSMNDCGEALKIAEKELRGRE